MTHKDPTNPNSDLRIREDRSKGGGIDGARSQDFGHDIGKVLVADQRSDAGKNTSSMQPGSSNFKMGQVGNAQAIRLEGDLTQINEQVVNERQEDSSLREMAGFSSAKKAVQDTSLDHIDSNLRSAEKLISPEAQKLRPPVPEVRELDDSSAME